MAADQEPKATDLMEKLVALCKRRGFIFQSSEIYGGINGFWDYGPLGVELKRNIKDAWWEDVVRKRDDMVGLDCAIIMNPKVWEASGHLGGFADPMVECPNCKGRFRPDQISNYSILDATGVPHDQVVQDLDSLQGIGRAVVALEEDAKGNAEQAQKAVRAVLGSKKAKFAGWRPWGFEVFDGEKRYCLKGVNIDTETCPRCFMFGLTSPRQFNLMFKTFVGAMEDSSAVAYLRPETAQGIFANYKNVLDTTRIKVPFGIAQVGKSFRNEINPRNFTFRSREFEQMEIEFFCHPNEADKWYEYWRKARYDWYVGLGLRSSKLRLRDHEKSELAHYARACADIEYEFPFGTSELEGVANRTDFDLKAHQNHPACIVKDLGYFDEDAWERDKAKFAPEAFGGDEKAAKEAAAKAKSGLPYRFVPYVIEPSGGVDRATLAFLCEAYTEDTAPDENGKPQARTLMKFHPRLAPIKVAVFPLVKKDGMPEIAEKIHRECKNAGLSSFYDEKGAVGRRYRRQDEAGTPFCVTVDGQTLTDQTVTIRDRDSLKQDRIPAAGVLSYVRERLHV